MTKSKSCAVAGDEKLFGVVSRHGWYFETPEELALSDSDEQKCVLRVFRTFDQAETYLSAVSAYNDHLGRMSVREVSTDKLKKEAEELNNFTFTSNRYSATLDVEYCTIGRWPSWPESVSTILSFSQNKDA